MHSHTTRSLFKAGFAFSLFLAGTCMIGDFVYLFVFMFSTSSAVTSTVDQFRATESRQIDLQRQTTDEVSKQIERLSSLQNDPHRLAILNNAIAARLALANLSLHACGVLAGISLAFLGFALFLLGIESEFDAEAASEKYSIKIAKMSPGAFAVLCAALLIGYCGSQRIKHDSKFEDSATTTRSPRSDGPTFVRNPDAER